MENFPRTQHNGIERWKVWEKSWDVETGFSSSKVNVKEYPNEGLESERGGNNQIKMVNNVLKLKKEV